MKADHAKIDALLSRNVENVVDAKALREELLSGRKLRVKLGIDPTSPDLHLGHAVVLGKLREFQDLGHKAVLIIGDFTGLIGDPSGRDKTRPPLTEKEIKNNFKKYIAQAGKIIDIKKAEVRYNSEWLGKLKGADILKLLAMMSVQQIMEREDFGKRWTEHKTIRMHELIYPIMQGYDSVAVKADVELGGTDQTFNLLVGRDLMEKFGMPAQDIMTSPLLVGLDGERKMSKSLGNYIALDEAPEETFGKVMSLPDRLVDDYFTLCTTIPAPEIKEIMGNGKGGGSARREAKARLGYEIVKRYHGASAAARAQEHFEKLFSKKETPENIPELKVGSSISVLDLAMASGSITSKSEARRLIAQGGVDLDGKPYKDPQGKIGLRGGEVLKLGKKRFFRIKLK